MAVATFAPSQLIVVPAVRPRPMSAMTRGMLFTLGGHVTSLARPIAIAWFARAFDSASLGGFFLIWACLELGSRFATLGLDRGLQRWADDRRAAAAIAGMVIAGLTALAVATILFFAVPRIAPMDGNAALMTRILLFVALPLTAMSNVALRSARGAAQIATFVLARGVTEPVLLLLAGLALSSQSDGSIALPAALMISVVGGAVVAADGLVRTFGLRELATGIVDVRAWPVRELVRTSLPLGLADLLQGAQAKLDLVAVAIVTFSTRAVASYAIAVEVATVFVAIRIGLDQIVAPLAAEARGNRGQLRRILATATRWSIVIAAPIAFVLLVSPGALLRWFGGSEGASLVLLVLATGRAVEMMLAPVASTLAIVGEPKLSLLDAATGVSVTVLGQLAAGLLGLGSVAIALASAAGMLASSLMAVFWVAHLRIARAVR